MYAGCCKAFVKDRSRRPAFFLAFGVKRYAEDIPKQSPGYANILPLPFVVDSHSHQVSVGRFAQALGPVLRSLLNRHFLKLLGHKIGIIILYHKPCHLMCLLQYLFLFMRCQVKVIVCCYAKKDDFAPVRQGFL
jgi:hypothetical protein